MMNKLAPEAFFKALKQRGINRFFGVPDSLLKDFCAFVTDNTHPREHVITANEGNAVAMAAGHHLATGEIPLVYMQNSGLGNTMNPLLSLTHAEVYKIPLLLVVGWRGAPGCKDEPQHVAQGRLSEKFMDTVEVPYSVLSATRESNVEDSMQMALDKAVNHIQSHGTPYALLVHSGTFNKYQLQTQKETIKGIPLSREEAIDQVLRQLDQRDIVVSTTGMPSREVFEIRERSGAGHARDFLTVGCMGHCSSIATGIALAKPSRQVFCLDGDGAAIMHMGSMAVVGGTAAHQPLSPTELPLLQNYKHVVLNNGAHDSVGGQATAGLDVSLSGVAKACGYTLVREEPVLEMGDLVKAMSELKSAAGPAFLEVIVRKGNRPDLGRPTTTPQGNKDAFMEFIKQD